MPKHEQPLDYLKRYIPEASAAAVLELIIHYKVQLTITRERRSILGDYRHATSYNLHRISVNGNLNKYSFLITLIHELAHLVTFEQYGHRVASHGKEWKTIYARLLSEFLKESIFPPDILQSLKNSLHDLPASSCSDEKLMRTLRRYDPANGMVLVEQIEEGALFSVDKGAVFKRGKKLRKRYQCTEIDTGRVYLFSSIYEVNPVKES